MGGFGRMGRNEEIKQLKYNIKNKRNNQNILDMRSGNETESPGPT